MLFIISKPYDPPTQLTILWLEVNTSAGNFVLQKGHAPMILAIKENSEIRYQLENGLEKTMLIKNGILNINRQIIKLITQ